MHIHFCTIFGTNELEITGIFGFNTTHERNANAEMDKSHVFGTSSHINNNGNYTIRYLKKRLTDLLYTFYIHGSIATIFGKNDAEKIGNQNVLYFPTSRN